MRPCPSDMRGIDHPGKSAFANHENLNFLSCISESRTGFLKPLGLSRSFPASRCHCHKHHNSYQYFLAVNVQNLEVLVVKIWDSLLKQASNGP